MYFRISAGDNFFRRAMPGFCTRQPFAASRIWPRNSTVGGGQSSPELNQDGIAFRHNRVKGFQPHAVEGRQRPAEFGRAAARSCQKKETIRVNL
jgi:hypothetical protein